VKEEVFRVSELVQKLAVQVLATHPAGEGMCLIGGFRYRLLDAGCRRSLDIDYHWPGDLAAKQAEIVALFRRKLVPLVRTRLGLNGDVRAATGPESESPAVRIVEVAVWRPGAELGRITIPVDITRIPCADRAIVRTVDGVVYLSASDADMAESKIIALFARRHPEERDMLDLFLFQDKLPGDSAGRVDHKLRQIGVSKAAMEETWRRMVASREYHIRMIEAIVREQVDPVPAANLRAAGGGAMIFDRVMEIVSSCLGGRREHDR